MNLMKLTVSSLMTAVLLAGCGGGGKDAGTSPFGSGGNGGGGGGTTASASLTIDLLNGSNASTRFTQGGQNYTAAVTLKDASGNTVPSTAVTVSATDFTLTPTSGRKLTGSNGVATVGLTQIDASASAATQICATAVVNATSLSNCLDIQMGAVSAQLGTLTTNPTNATVAAYQSIQVSVPATLDGSTPAVGVPVNFTATCGKVSPASINTNSSGVAQVSYTNDNAGGTCSGSQTISAATESETKTVNITTQAATASSIAFKGATRPKIYLQGSPGASSSVVTFQLLNQNSVPIQGQTLVLDFVQRPAGASLREAGTASVESTTDASGNVSVTVLSGTAPGPVQIRAQLKNVTPVIFNVSNGLSIASGLPTQNAFSLSVSTFNIEAWNEDGVTTFLTVRAADRLGNPVPDGTAINFISAGGQVVASCLTTGAEAATTSGCSVTLSSQSPRPTNGRVTVLAWAQGEETFVDNSNPRNNVYDAATDTFEDLGQPFLDSNFDGVFDPGEAAVARASGTSACLPATSNVAFKVVPNTCDGVWGTASVFRKTEIVFSGNVPDGNKLNMAGSVPSAGRCLYTFDIQDERGNPLPAGSTLAVGGVTGGTFLGFGGEGDKVPNTNEVARTSHSAIFNACPNLANLEFTLSVTTPKGVKTSFFVP